MISLFNAQAYLRQNPDVAEAVEQGYLTAEQHFELYGQAEGRSPGPYFDVDYYLASNPDVAEIAGNNKGVAYVHFLNYGLNEGRSSVPFFDPEFYLSQNPDVAQAVHEGHGTAIQHFLIYGLNEPRQISVSLNLKDYLEANPDVAQAVSEGHVEALSHLLTYGVAEGRDLGNGISLKDFANDPIFNDALTKGDTSVALVRVDSIAPFMPDFKAPTNWALAVDTQLPTDFVPVEGKSLIIPEGIEITEDTAIPPAFDVQKPSTPEPEEPGGEDDNTTPGVPTDPEVTDPVEPEPTEPEEPGGEDDNTTPGVPTDPEVTDPVEPAIPDLFYSFAHYHEHDNSLLIMGHNLDSILASDENREVNIKNRFDWGKMQWNPYTANAINFGSSDVKSVTIEKGFFNYLKIEFSPEKTDEIREKFLYGSFYGGYNHEISIERGFIQNSEGEAFDIPWYSANLVSSYELTVSENEVLEPAVSPRSGLTIKPDHIEEASHTTIKAKIDGENILSNRIWIEADSGELEIKNLNTKNTELKYSSSNFDVIGNANIIASGSGLYYVSTQDGDDHITSTNPNGTVFNTGGGNDTLIGGDGDDIFIFSSTELTEKDVIDGGYGNNSLQIDGDALITDEQFTNIKNISWLTLDEQGDHEISLGTLAGKTFRGDINVSSSSNEGIAGSLELDASQSLAKLRVSLEVQESGSINIQGGSDDDYFYTSGAGSVTIAFADSADNNGFDDLILSSQHERTILDFSNFLGKGSKETVISNYDDHLNLIDNNHIGVMYNNSYISYYDISSIENEGKITIEDNGKAVILTSNRSDPNFSDGWRIHYIEDVNPEDGVQEWNIKTVGYISSSSNYSGGFTTYEIADFDFM